MTKNKLIWLFSFLILSLLIGVFSFAQTNKNISDSSTGAPQPTPARATYKPEEGYVPDAETAIAIAVAVWNPIYGKKKIAGEKPYRASLKDGVWTVRGSLPKGMKGGVAEVDISKDDGRILRLIHGK